MLTLISFFKKVNDPRQDSGKRHPLWLILLLVVFGVMCGNLGYRDIAAFAKSHQKLLTEVFQLKQQVMPSYSTIRRVMMLVKTSELVEIFNEWAGSLANSQSEKDWVSIAGKSLRSTCKNYDTKSQNFISIVSLFSQSSGWVLRLQNFQNKKSSEIEQVQELVKAWSQRGQVFTLDALHCQKQTTTLITQSDNDYIIALKRPQKKLFNEVVKISESQSAESEDCSVDISHGRQITRKVSVFEMKALKSPDFDASKWGRISRLIKVERSGSRQGKNYQHLAYYLSSLSESAEVFAARIREHWLIENQLHWVKDVIFQEDKWPRHHYRAVTNFSILERMALNLYRFLGFLSVKAGQRWLNHKLENLLLVIS